MLLHLNRVVLLIWFIFLLVGKQLILQVAQRAGVQRKRLMHYRRLLLPMSDDEVTVNMLLGAANIQPIS